MRVLTHRNAALIAFALASMQGIAAAAPSAVTRTQSENGTNGTTIVSDREAAVGLYLMPWKGDSAAGDIDLVPLQLDVPATPVNPRNFTRRVKFHDSADEYDHAQYERRD